MHTHEHLEGLADDDLFRNIVQGCTDCFALLFHRYCRQVFSVSFRIIRDKAETEDILQEVFLSIYLQKERYDASRGSIRTWILQFAYFKSLLRRRYLRIRHFYSEEEVSEAREMWESHGPDVMGMSSGEWARYVETGIATLGVKQQRVMRRCRRSEPAIWWRLKNRAVWCAILCAARVAEAWVASHRNANRQPRTGFALGGRGSVCE